MTLLEYLEREALSLAHRLKRANGVNAGIYRRALVLLQLAKALPKYAHCAGGKETCLNLALSQVVYVYTACGGVCDHFIILDYIREG